VLRAGPLRKLTGVLVRDESITHDLEERRDDFGCRDTIRYERKIDETSLMDDRALVQSAATGDSAAFESLYLEHIASVYRYALQMLRNIPEAEDVAQEVFILAWVKRTKIRVVDRSVLPWLLVTTRNLSLNKLKKTHRDARNASLDAGEGVTLRSDQDAEETVMGQLLAAAIEDAVDELSSTDQTLYHLCISEGVSYQKAADALGVTHGAVRNRLTRVRRTLQTTLAIQKEGMS
jgi:RNA polymerase sigma factor (sigma-70 family)